MTSSKPNRTQKVEGHLNRQGCIQIAVRMDRKTFENLRDQAVKDKMSIAAKIREYIEIGLEVDIDLDDTPDITTFEGVSS